jgi:hypothetical protein
MVEDGTGATGLRVVILSGGFTSFIFLHLSFRVGIGVFSWLRNWAGQMMHIASVRATQILLSSKSRPGMAQRIHFAFFLASLYVSSFIGFPSFQDLSRVTPAPLIYPSGPVPTALAHASYHGYHEVIKLG